MFLENVLANNQSHSSAISLGNGSIRNYYSYACRLDFSCKGFLYRFFMLPTDKKFRIMLVE